MNTPKRVNYNSTPCASPRTPASSEPLTFAYAASSQQSWNSSRRLKNDQKWKHQTATTAALFNTMNLHQACKSNKFNVKVLSNTSSGRPPRRLVSRHKQFTYWNQISKLTDDSEEPGSDRGHLFHA